MSSNRAQANHSLYLAKLQLVAWRNAVAAQDVAAGTLDQAFLPAVRDHLVTAYGWFLLAITDGATVSDGPPRCCADLPAVIEGKALPGEIREFQQLESNGWLSQLLAAKATPGAASPSPGNLASSAAVLPGPEEATRWSVELENLFERMSNSLDEY